MLASGIIQRSGSNYASDVVLWWQYGTMRVCLDNKPVNEVTDKDSRPLLRTDEVLNELGKAQWFSKLDLKSGYWQMVVDSEDRHKTAFMTWGWVERVPSDAFWFHFNTCDISQIDEPAVAQGHGVLE